MKDKLSYSKSSGKGVGRGNMAETPIWLLGIWSLLSWGDCTLSFELSTWMPETTDIPNIL